MESATSSMAPAKARSLRSCTTDMGDTSLLTSGIHEADSQSLIDTDAANWAMGESGARSFGYSRDWGTQEIDHLFGAHSTKGVDLVTGVRVISHSIVNRSVLSMLCIVSLLSLSSMLLQVDQLLADKKYVVSAACTRRHKSQLVGRGCGICAVGVTTLAWLLGVVGPAEEVFVSLHIVMTQPFDQVFLLFLSLFVGPRSSLLEQRA